MKNNLLYIRLKSIISNYSLDQIRNATDEQILNALGNPNISDGFLAHMKRVAIQYVKDKIEQEKFDALKIAFKSYLDANFPNYVVRHSQDKEGHYIKLYYDGVVEEGNE